MAKTNKQMAFDYKHEVLVYSNASLIALLDELHNRGITYMVGYCYSSDMHVVMIDKDVKRKKLLKIKGLDKEGDGIESYLVYDAFERTTILRFYPIDLAYFDEECPDVKVTEAQYPSGGHTIFSYRLEWPANSTSAHEQVQYVLADLHLLT